MSESPVGPSAPPVVIVASTIDSDREYLCGLFKAGDIRVIQARTCIDVVSAAEESGNVVAVLCDESFPWRDLLSSLASHRNPLRIVLTATVPYGALCGEFLNIGGFDVLAKPFNEADVRWVISSACSPAEGDRNERGAGARSRIHTA